MAIQDTIQQLKALVAQIEQEAGAAQPEQPKDMASKMAGMVSPEGMEKKPIA